MSTTNAGGIAPADFTLDLHASVSRLARSVELLVERVSEDAGAPFRRMVGAAGAGGVALGELVGTGALDTTFLHAFNPGNVDAFLQLYDAGSADAVLPGQTRPVQTYWLQAGGGVDGVTARMAFMRGLVVAVTTSVDGGAPPATPALVNIATVARR